MLHAVYDPLERLGSRVRQRRLELGLTQRDAALAAGISDTTWLAVERGEKTSERTLVGVERALRWAAGSAEAVMGGADPTELASAERTLEQRVAILEAELLRLRDELAAERRSSER
jgi:transcriptional regulator with XRE-family HTH domain